MMIDDITGLVLIFVQLKGLEMAHGKSLFKRHGKRDTELFVKIGPVAGPQGRF